jgi:hypothetical protein
VLAGVAFASWGTPTGITFAAAATALGCLAGLELAIREHFAAYRSHCLVLGGLLGGAGAVLSALVIDDLVFPTLVFVAVGGVAAWLLRISFIAKVDTRVDAGARGAETNTWTRPQAHERREGRGPAFAPRMPDPH